MAAAIKHMIQTYPPIEFAELSTQAANTNWDTSKKSWQHCRQCDETFGLDGYHSSGKRRRDDPEEEGDYCYEVQHIPLAEFDPEKDAGFFIVMIVIISLIENSMMDALLPPLNIIYLLSACSASHSQPSGSLFKQSAIFKLQ